VLDVDGNSWSGRFRRLLKSNSLVFKSSIWPEWYRDHIQPWYHYVPVRIDYAELFDLMSFFTGAPDPDPPHPQQQQQQQQQKQQLPITPGFEHLAKRIAGQGSAWADEHFRYQDIRACMLCACPRPFFSPPAALFIFCSFLRRRLENVSRMGSCLLRRPA
jgi:hypothetical protein